jgi:hypothetical protein
LERFLPYLVLQLLLPRAELVATFGIVLGGHLFPLGHQRLRLVAYLRRWLLLVGVLLWGLMALLA